MLGYVSPPPWQLAQQTLGGGVHSQQPKEKMTAKVVCEYLFVDDDVEVHS